MWKLQSVFALFHPAPYRQIMFTPTCSSGVGVGGIWFSSVLTRPFAFFLPDQYKKLRNRNGLLILGPFFLLGSVSPSECVFSPDESLALDCGLLAFISFLLVLTRQTFHFAEQRGCRNQRLETPGPLGLLNWLLSLLSQGTTSSLSQRSISACRATWIWDSEERL